MIVSIQQELEKHLGSNRVLQNITLASYTTLRLGGPAEFFFVAKNRQDLINAYSSAKKLQIPLTILGGGTNVLISDAGISGLVVRNESRGIKVIKRIGKVKNGKMETRQIFVEVESGTLINQLVRFTCDEGYAGLERHLGLPGTIGGALYMNSKWTKPICYVGDVLYQAKIIADSGELNLVDQNYFNFGYDQSILQKTHEIVVSVIFLFTPQDPKVLWERANASMEYRKNSQPMGAATAGCTFRNIAYAQAIRLATPNNTTSAGYLVDQVGLKGFQVGSVKFSDKHANFMLNDKGVKSADAKALIEEAKQRVKQKFDIEIEPEIVLLGSF